MLYTQHGISYLSLSLFSQRIGRLFMQCALVRGVCEKSLQPTPPHAQYVLFSSGQRTPRPRSTETYTFSILRAITMEKTSGPNQSLRMIASPYFENYNSSLYNRRTNMNICLIKSMYLNRFTFNKSMTVYCN